MEKEIIVPEAVSESADLFDGMILNLHDDLHSGVELTDLGK